MSTDPTDLLSTDPTDLLPTNLIRPDLLSLTLDDLIVLSNRGLVNRAVKEVEAGKVTATIAQTGEGSLEFSWSDGVTCTLPRGSALNETCCSCSATQICRHLLRSILAYQSSQQTIATALPATTLPETPLSTPETEEPVPIISPGKTSPERASAERSSPAIISPEKTSTERSLPERSPDITPPEMESDPFDPPPAIVPERNVPQAWDPGDIPDAVLEPYYKPAEWKRLQHQYAQGQIIELSRSAKPTASFHQWGITTRFMVPGDVRYVYCSCGEALSKGDNPTLCQHIPLAVWGFRSLREQFPHQATGLISTEVFEPIAPSGLAEIEAIVAQVLSLGITQLSTASLGQIKRVQNRCETEGLIWLSDIWAELLHQHSDYQNQNAQFQPSHVTELLMEAECRLRAMQAPHCPVPQLWIRGSACDRSTSMGSTTLVGLGCGVQVGQKAVQLQVYVQDLKSGQVLILGRTHQTQTDPPDQTPFAQLALKSGFKRFSLAHLGRHQTIIKGGKRLPNQEFRPARNTAANLNPQTFAWENLRPPLLVENIEVLQAHLAQSPPPALRPRRLAANFWVITIAQVGAVEFSSIDQCITAALTDPQGNPLTLRHPYFDRGAAGAEILLHRLQHSPDRLRFVSGLVHQTANGLVIQPIALIWENQQGQRSMFQPWIETHDRQSGQETQSGRSVQPDREALTSSDFTSSHFTSSDFTSTIPSPQQILESYLAQVKTLVTDLLLLGLEAKDLHLRRQIQDCYEQGRALGFHQLLTSLEILQSEFQRKADDPHWNSQASQGALRELLVWLSLAIDSSPLIF